MNRQPNHNTAAVRILSTKETTMNRRIATLIAALFAVLVLSACAVESPFQGTGSVTVLPSEPGPMNVRPESSGIQIVNHQQLADYQANLPAAVGPSVLAYSLTASNGSQIRNRRQLADYQAALPVYVARPVVKVGVAEKETQISSRQALADYQATLPLYVGKARPALTVVQQISDRQALAEYQTTLGQ